MQAAEQHLTSLLTQNSEVNGFLNETLGPARDRLTDEHNPPTLEEVNTIIQKIQNEMPSAVRDEMPMHQAPADVPERTVSVKLPDLGS